MFGTMGDPPKRAGSMMPPATTRRLPDRPVASTREARIAPPYIPAGPAQHASPAEPHPEATPAPEPVTPVTLHEPVPETTQAAAAAMPMPESAEPPSEPWEEIDVEGVVEPAFEADTDAVLEELTSHADAAPREEFPLDAFIVPEQAQHVPTGLEGAPATPPPEPTPTTSLAERLEKLSHRLRVEDSDAVVRRLAAGDRLDALLAGLLAGYLAGKSDGQ